MRKLNVEYDIVRIIDCLSEEERAEHQDSKKLMEFLAGKGVKQETAYCGNKVSVLHVLNSLKQKAESGEKFPLVFISHGDEGFLAIKHENESIEWHELGPFLQEINQLMNGDLVVLMACCNGFNGYKMDVRDSQNETFFGIVGPIRTITPNESIRANEIFFESMLNDPEIPAAVDKINNEIGANTYKRLAVQDNKLI